MKIGAIPFSRADDGGLQFYLVSTSGNRKRFAFPKGHVGKGEGNRGEDWLECVMRELHEEAGLEGRLVLPNMPIAIPNKKTPKDGVMYYWVEVTNSNEKWLEDTKRHKILRSGKELKKVKLNNTSKKVLKVFREIGFDPAEKNPSPAKDGLGAWILDHLLDKSAK